MTRDSAGPGRHTWRVVADGGGTMAGMIRKSVDVPEETRGFEGGMGKLELGNLDTGAVGRATFEPGWQWSKHVKPIAKTEWCEAPHFGYTISGRAMIKMSGGEEYDTGPGDVFLCP